MDYSRFSRRLAWGILLWMLVTLPLHASAELRTVRNAHFETIGLDQRSIYYFNELTLFAVPIAERYLNQEGLAYPRPILVSLRPEAHVDFEGDYQIRLLERGAVALDIRWEAGLSLERTCYALAEALLVQYALYNHGPGADQRVKAWVVDALAEKVYLGLRPAEYVQRVEDMRELGLPSLELAVKSSRVDEGAGQTAGNWLLLALQADGLKRSTRRGLFQQAVAGMDVYDTLLAAVQSLQGDDEPVDLQFWWEANVREILQGENEVIETMEDSRQWMAALGSFVAPVEVESEEIELDLRKLWTHRKAPKVEELIRARYELLRLRMGRINFAYFNAAKSLGVLYESLLEDVPSHKYMYFVAIYLSDWEDAQAMQRAIDEKMKK